jgi:FkbM family methyltransferase
VSTGKRLRAAVVRGIINAARMAGYEMTPLWRLESRPLVLHLRKLFTRYSVDCVFDVGANQGQYRDLLREEVGFEGLIVSYEPVRRHAELLRQRASKDTRWEIVDCALGTTAGHAMINVTASPGLSSFLPPRQDVVQGFWRADSIEGTESVRVERLDAQYARLRAQHPFRSPYLKIDTQGFDLEVLKGGESVLAMIVALQTELSVRPIYEGAPTSIEMQSYLEAAGFDLSGLFPVIHDEGLRLLEMDCVAVNRGCAEGRPR